MSQVRHTRIKEHISMLESIACLAHCCHDHAAAEDIVFEEMVSRTRNEFGLSVMGTARSSSEFHTQLFDELASELPGLQGVHRVINGGGPGSMEAVSRTASKMNLKILEVPIPLPGEVRKSSSGIESKRIHAHSLGSRVRIFDAHSDIWWGILPGIGTVHEILDICQRVQLERTFGPRQRQNGGPPYVARSYNGLELIPPIILIGPAWQGIMSTFEHLAGLYKTIDKEDLSLVTHVSTVAEAVHLTNVHVRRWQRAQEGQVQRYPKSYVQSESVMKGA